MRNLYINSSISLFLLVTAHWFFVSYEWLESGMALVSCVDT